MVLPRQIGVPPWKVFARVGIAALIVTALFAAWAAWLLATNGTAQSMAALAPQVAGLTCIGGAIICGVVALVLRLRDRAGSADGQTSRNDPQ